MSLLRIDQVFGGYGGVDILKGLDLVVGEDEIVMVAGTNGAGKSTLVKAVMGLLPDVRGRISFGDIDLLSRSAEQRADLGISYVPQVANVFGSLSVTENLVAQCRARSGGRASTASISSFRC